ncbi:hypothetical protein HQQ81_14900 [Microbacteriaceae bacterium VKM Ac-2854]|nr:hypothetical protein [Microbacteriaceae bacterium VKM Ac-2854]
MKKLIAALVTALVLAAAGAVAPVAAAAPVSFWTTQSCHTGTTTTVSVHAAGGGYEYNYAPGDYCFGSTTGSQAHARFLRNGDFVLLSGTKVIWQSHTGNKGATALRFQNDGNLVIYRGSTMLWQSRTVGTPGAVYDFAVYATGSMQLSAHQPSRVVWTAPRP